MDRAQSQSDRRAVEGLIRSLQGPAAAKPAGPPASPAPTVPDNTASQAKPPAQGEPKSGPTTIETARPVPPPLPDTAAPAATEPPDSAKAAIVSRPPADRPSASSTPAPAGTQTGDASSSTSPEPTIALPALVLPAAPPPVPAVTTARPAKTPAPDAPAAPIPPVPASAPVEPTAAPAQPASPPPPAASPPPSALAARPSPPKADPAIPRNAVDIASQRKLPSVDIEVYFDFNATSISKRAVATLSALGKALSDPRLAGATFLIAGHTDAKGRDDYNQRLSEERASAVRTFLIERFAIVENRLISRGYGETRLKNTKQPYAVENRRVQIINWTSQLAR